MFMRVSYTQVAVKLHMYQEHWRDMWSKGLFNIVGSFNDILDVG
jgi:hypothetical protein